jgi:hypothetical protein
MSWKTKTLYRWAYGSALFFFSKIDNMLSAWHFSKTAVLGGHDCLVALL